MSTSTEITRLQNARNTIRTKFVEMGIATSTAKLDALATAAEGIENRGAVNAQVQEGATYTIPKGYHNGSGVVAGVAGGGNYSLQEKTVTPTKAQQNVVPDSGYYGMSAVTVNPIPENFHDVSATTAAAGDVLANKVFIGADGETVSGTMPNNGAVSKTLDASTTSHTIAKGYHSGAGSVKIVPETKTVTPTKAAQDVTPTSGKVLTKVSVAKIPDNFIDTTDADAAAEEVLSGKTAYVDGEKVEGTMADNGAVTQTLTPATPSYTIPQGYHNGSGKVSITPETKSATPTKSAQTITPSTGKVLSSVTVAAIPDAYQDVTGVTATAPDVLDGKNIVLANGEKVEGAMPNNGATGGSIDGLTTTSVDIPAGYTTGGTISLTDDIETALASI